MYVYDIETYPNCFTCITHCTETNQRWVHEISDRVNHLTEFLALLDYIKVTGGRMVGFNNVNFDYPVIHNAILTRRSGVITAELIYAEAMRLISDDSPFKSVREPEIPQVDLFLINHFNNMAKSTSLKALEYAMRMEKIQDLPIEVGTVLTWDQCTDLITYNHHDVDATVRFFKECEDMIQFRDNLTKKYPQRDFTNFDNVKCGVEILACEIDAKQPNTCYVNGKRTGTFHKTVNLNECILPRVQLNHPEFKRIEGLIRAKTLKVGNTKGAFSDLTATIDGFSYDFGVGGLHGCVPPQIVHSDDEFMIVDVDVASYYPNLATANDIYPAHIGPVFCEVYKEMYEVRKQYKKGTMENSAMKLALNGSFGKTNSEYSYLYDSKYTFTITVNGQLLLAMLIENFIKIKGLQMLQVNTDGVTVRIPRAAKGMLDEIVKWWMDHTGLVLEEALYSRMFIRDCNNYIAEYEGGKLKRKGAYEYETEWHQDPSSPVIAMCAEKVLLNGEHPTIAVFSHKEIMDFMIRIKIRRKDKLVDENDNEYQRINRVLPVMNGTKLWKVSPPTGTPQHYKKKTGVSDEEYLSHDNTVWNPDVHTKNKSVHEPSRSVCVGGRSLKVMNDLPEDLEDYFKYINYGYFIKEVEKLTQPLITS